MQKTTDLLRTLLRTLLTIHQNCWEPSFWEVMDSFFLLGYASLAGLRTFLQQLLACLNFTSNSEDSFGTNEKVISMNYASSTSSWKPWRWVRPDLILDINSNLNPLTKFTSNSRSTEFKDILTWNISQMIAKTIPISMRIVTSNVMRQGIPLWIWWKVKGNLSNNKIRISQCRESHCKANTSIRRNK